MLSKYFLSSYVHRKLSIGHFKMSTAQRPCAGYLACNSFRAYKTVNNYCYQNNIDHFNSFNRCGIYQTHVYSLEDALKIITFAQQFDIKFVNVIPSLF